MSEPFLGEIRIFAANFAPRGWAFCEGQLLAISQNDALFSLLGTIYGGDGRTTFGLPDLRGRVPIHRGQGPGLSNRREGSKGGAEQVTLLASQMPAHTHGFRASTNPVEATAGPNGSVVADAGSVKIYAASQTSVDLSPTSITSTGQGQAHGNLAPFLCVNFIIALVGIYPSRQ